MNPRYNPKKTDLGGWNPREAMEGMEALDRRYGTWWLLIIWKMRLLWPSIRRWRNGGLRFGVPDLGASTEGAWARRWELNQIKVYEGLVRWMEGCH